MIFIVNYYQYKVRCNKAIPVSSTGMTPTGESSRKRLYSYVSRHWDDTLTTVIPLRVSAAAV
ncbi:hypothetical protein [Wolbachia endosymbiont (group A) of Bibio marci]|uniref:hypothetical protein n=1 Tax=Wolbachia endosymbiont (group A) of Bibio marci TaxID=2953987 RepID=UPI0022305C33|nr:hypothetical protein [Wolbachia endosymbiont (group A) of Bibio marci]